MHSKRGHINHNKCHQHFPQLVVYNPDRRCQIGQRRQAGINDPAGPVHIAQHLEQDDVVLRLNGKLLQRFTRKLGTFRLGIFQRGAQRPLGDDVEQHTVTEHGQKQACLIFIFEQYVEECFDIFMKRLAVNRYDKIAILKTKRAGACYAADVLDLNECIGDLAGRCAGF